MTSDKTAVQKKTAALLTAALQALPKRLRCPKCGRARSREDFGLRVMARDAAGLPTRISRQSYCKDCRA
jgi:hypothetical protein